MFYLILFEAMKWAVKMASLILLGKLFGAIDL
jgi:hypothetical protein